MSCSLSIIIPCHNGERFLAETIESALHQTVSAAEIIVVDDGSTDQTRQIAESHAVRYIYQPNQGAAVARNSGIAASRGEYLVFLDSDDRLLPAALATGLQSLKEHPDAGFGVGSAQKIDELGLPQPGTMPHLLPNRSIYETLLSGTSLHPPARFIFQRQVVEQIGGFDPALRSADDYDFYLRAAAVAPGYYHGQAVVEYRQHGASITHSTRSTQHLREALIILRKQRPALQARPDYALLHRSARQSWIQMHGPYLIYDAAFWLKRRQVGRSVQSLIMGLRYYPQGLLDYGLVQLKLKPLPGLATVEREAVQEVAPAARPARATLNTRAEAQEPE